MLFRSPRTGKKNDPGRSSVQNFESRDIKFPERDIKLPERDIKLPERDIKLPERDIKLPEREIKNSDVVYDVRELVKEERQGRRSNSGEIIFSINGKSFF